MKYISTKNMSHEDWLRARQNGIGGSDAWKIVLPEDEYKKAGCGKLYLEKIAEEVHDEPSLAARRGTYDEQFIADEFERRTGYKVHRVNSIMVSDEHPFMFANIDRKLSGKEEGLECKTTSYVMSRMTIFDEEAQKTRWISRFIEGDMENSLKNRMDWYIQIQHYMAVTGWKMWYLAVGIDINQFMYYPIPRDEPYIEYLIEEEEKFWGCVQRRENIWEE